VRVQIFPSFILVFDCLISIAYCNRFSLLYLFYGNYKLFSSFVNYCTVGVTTMVDEVCLIIKSSTSSNQSFGRTYPKRINFKY